MGMPIKLNTDNPQQCKSFMHIRGYGETIGNKGTDSFYKKGADQLFTGSEPALAPNKKLIRNNVEV